MSIHFEGFRGHTVSAQPHFNSIGGFNMLQLRSQSFSWNTCSSKPFPAASIAGFIVVRCDDSAEVNGWPLFHQAARKESHLHGQRYPSCRLELCFSVTADPLSFQLAVEPHGKTIECMWFLGIPLPYCAPKISSFSPATQDHQSRLASHRLPPGSQWVAPWPSRWKWKGHKRPLDTQTWFQCSIPANIQFMMAFMFTMLAYLPIEVILPKNPH